MSRELTAMTRLEFEQQIPLKKAAPLFPWRPTVRSIQRYCTHGRRVADLGTTIFLESFRSSHGRITSAEAVQRFIIRLNGGEPE